MNTEEIDISKCDKAEVLAALYNASRKQGRGFIQSRGRERMTKEQAASEVATHMGENYKGEPTCYFDYLHGRVMKVELGGGILKTWLYDRDNGEGAAARAIEHLLPVEA